MWCVFSAPQIRMTAPKSVWGNWRLTLVDNSMHVIPRWEADSSSVSQNIPSLYESWNVITASSILLLFLRNTYPAHAFHPVPMTPIVPFIFHVRVSLSTSLFFLLSPTRVFLVFLFLHIRATWFALHHSSWYDSKNNIWQGIPNVELTRMHILQYYLSLPLLR